jgi:hypothetical protein
VQNCPGTTLLHPDGPSTRTPNSVLSAEDDEKDDAIGSSIEDEALQESPENIGEDEPQEQIGLPDEENESELYFLFFFL